MNDKTKAPAKQDFKDCKHWGKGGSYVVTVAGGKRVRQGVVTGPVVTAALAAVVATATAAASPAQETKDAADLSGAADAAAAAPNSQDANSGAKPIAHPMKKETARG